MRQIKITMGRVILTVTLLQTATADAVWSAAPFEALANTWGGKIYFRTPAVAEAEPDAGPVVDLGQVAFWPEASAIAIGFGPTPISEAGEIRLAGSVNIFGTCHDDLRALKTITDGMLVQVERLST